MDASATLKSVAETDLANGLATRLLVMDAESESQFREFVAARSLALRRTAYALTGDLHQAEDLVQGALIKLAGR